MVLRKHTKLSVFTCNQFYEESGALNTILGLLESYLDKDLEMMSSGSDSSGLWLSTTELGSDSSVEDVIIKVRCLFHDITVTLDCCLLDIQTRFS